MELLEKIVQLQNKILQEIYNSHSSQDLKNVTDTSLSKKSEFNGLMSNIKDLSGDEKIEFGRAMNKARAELNEALKAKQEELRQEEIAKKLANESIDITLPASNENMGGINPFHLITDEIIDIFVSMGYEVKEGPDVETDYFNFERMNIPHNHPAREMQDSFYITNSTLLRTHTSPAQAHVMDEKKGEPIKIICPGKCYRRDDDDATHSHEFTQIEGLVVNKTVTMAELKGTLTIMAKRLFGDDREIRLRPSYFPFTEPSIEVDVSCFKCHGKGCALCKGTGWIEILGAGMVNNNVLEMCGYDPKVYQGFAFGVGAERIAMLKYGIEDIRTLYANDLRQNKQFK